MPNGIVFKLTWTLYIRMQWDKLWLCFNSLMDNRRTVDNVPRRWATGVRWPMSVFYEPRVSPLRASSAFPIAGVLMPSANRR